jgi:hypothetical protein
MKIKSIIIELTASDQERTREQFIESRTLMLGNGKWSVKGDNDGLFPGEVRLVSMIEEVRSKVGSI